MTTSITHYVDMGRVGFPARLSSDGRSAIAAVSGPWVREGQVIATQRHPGYWQGRIFSGDFRVDVREVRRRGALGDRTRLVRRYIEDLADGRARLVVELSVWVPEGGPDRLAGSWVLDEVLSEPDQLFEAPCWRHGGCDGGIEDRDGSRAPRRGKGRRQ